MVSRSSINAWAQLMIDPIINGNENILREIMDLLSHFIVLDLRSKRLSKYYYDFSDQFILIKALAISLKKNYVIETSFVTILCSNFYPQATTSFHYYLIRCLIKSRAEWYRPRAR